MLAMALTLGIGFVGCATNLKESYSGTAYQIGVPEAKDVEILGLVRYEAVVEKGNGEKLTYDALLREAEKLGGNGIVNIMIDVKRQGTKFLWMYLNPQETWYGSALAIKYLNENLTTPAGASTSDLSGQTSGGSGGEQKKFLGIF
jgi:hypothetical protein